MKGIQYTLRQVSQKLDKTLRHKARQEKCSLNKIALKALTAGAGIADQPVLYHDLDNLAGSWKHDPKFYHAVLAQDKIDPDLWK